MPPIVLLRDPTIQDLARGRRQRRALPDGGCSTPLWGLMQFLWHLVGTQEMLTGQVKLEESSPLDHRGLDPPKQGQRTVGWPTPASSQGPLLPGTVAASVP